MATLTGKLIANTYKDLLQISNGNSGIDGTFRKVSDGEGTDSALRLNNAGVDISGTFFFRRHTSLCNCCPTK